MLCSPTQSTEVLCAGVEIPVNPVMLVSRQKLLPGLNDDLQELPKEWLLWEVLKYWREQQRMAVEWLCELGFQHKTYIGVVIAITKHRGGGEGGERRENEAEGRETDSTSVIGCCCSVFNIWLIIRVTWGSNHGVTAIRNICTTVGILNHLQKQSTITHYFSIVGRGWGREVVVVN